MFVCTVEGVPYRLKPRVIAVIQSKIFMNFTLEFFEAEQSGCKGGQYICRLHFAG